MHAVRPSGSLRSVRWSVKRADAVPEVEGELDWLVGSVMEHVDRLALGVDVVGEFGVHPGPKLDGMFRVHGDLRHAADRIAA